MNTTGIMIPQFRYIKGFFRITRLPNLIILAAAQYSAALFLVGEAHEIYQYLFSTRLFLLSLSTVIIAAAGYIINDYYDVKIDYINKPRQVIIGKLMKRRVAMITHTVFNFIGISVGFYLSPAVGIINFTAAFSLWLYSNRLKRLPLIGNFIIAALTGLGIAVVAFYFQENELLVYIYATFAFAISLVREVIKDMEDVKGDELFGCRTLPVVWGIARTKRLLYLLIAFFIFLLFFLSGILKNQTLTNYFIILTIPISWFIYRLVYADKKVDFALLSNAAKLIMLSGMLSMIFFK